MNRLLKISLAMVAISTSLVVATDWPSFAGDAANSGNSQDYTPRNLNSADVTTSANLGIKNATSAVIKNGKVYVYANGSTGTLYCLNAESLAIEWQSQVMVDDSFGYSGWASPAIGDDCIVYGVDSFLGCWNLDGTERWSIAISNGIGNSSGKIADGKVLASCFKWGNAQAGIAAYDILTGSNIWFATDPSFANFSACTPAIDISAGKGYACAGAYVFQFDLNSGDLGWNVALPNAVALQNISMSGDSLFTVDFIFSSYTAGSNLYSVSKTDGSLKWIAQTIVSDIAPAINGNILVHSSGDGWGVPQELTGFDFNTGTQLWKIANLGGWNFMPAISKDVVYASGNNTTNLTCVNIADGSVVSKIVIGGCSPAIANDTLYTVFNGVLYAYSHKAEAMSIDKANVKIMLGKDNKDAAKLSASISMETSPATWLNNSMSLKFGGISFLAEDTQEPKKSDDKKVLWKFISTDKTSKVTIKWIAKKKVMQLKASVKKFNLRNSIPYKTEDGTETSNVTTTLQAGDYNFYAKSVDSMTTETKKDKVKLKFKK